MDEFESIAQDVESVEIQSGSSETSVDTDADMAFPSESVESEEDIPEVFSDEILEDSSENSDDSSEVSDSVSSEKVAEIVDVLLQSDRVTGLMQSLEDTLQTVAEVIPTVREAEPVQPVTVVSVDDVLGDLLDRLEKKDSQPVSVETTVVPQIQTESVSLAEVGAEILVPDSGEISVIQLVQNLLSYFQEDDHNLLTNLKTLVTDIKTNTAPRPFMETPFAEYSVVEGLLLVLVWWLVVLKPCVYMIKGGFSWLLS